MKAIVYARYGSPENLELRDVEEPVPGAGEVIVQVRAASANALDYRRFQAPSGFGRLMDERIFRMVGNVLGADIAGTVLTLGPGVAGVRVGDEVFGVATKLRGGFAERARARQEQLAPKPADLSFVEAAAVPTAAVTALRCLGEAEHSGTPRTVLVHGASGGVGTFAVQIARSLGDEVTAVCSARNADVMRELGAARVVDYAREDFAAAATRYDLIVGVNGDRSILDYRRALRPGGTYVAVGGSMRQILQGLLVGPLLSLVGGKRLRSVGVATVRAEDLRRLGELLRAGRVTPILDRVVPLAEASSALRYLAEGHATGKVVLEIAG